MNLELSNNARNYFQLPVVVVDQRYMYAGPCETSGVTCNVDVRARSAQEAEMANESCLEYSEITDFAHFDNETAIAAVEEISDGEQKQEIESVIEEMINSDDIKFPVCERYYYKVREGRRKRHWSHEWQNLGGESASMYEQSVDTPVNSTANVLHRKPKKRLFAHR